MKRYEAYIETTVNWMGSIPSNWILSKLKYEVKCLDGSRVPVEKSQRNEGPYPYWGAGSITCYVDNYLFDEELVLLGEDGAPFFDPYRPVAFYVNEKVWVNNHIHVLKPQNRVIGKYLTYLLNTVDYGNHINGSILNKLTQYNMDEIAVCLPSIEEQKIIAAYLDYKVGQIDKSISEIDSQIDSLKVYRQSVISEAVTKGLDKNAKMKDSGVEWIGEIPEGWAIQKIKNVLFPSKDGIKIGPFGSSLTGKIDTIGNYKVYGQWNIVGRDFSAGKNYVDSDTYNDLSAYHITAGDILVSMMGTVGKCAIIPDGVAKGLMDSHVVKVRLNKEKIIPEFFEYVYDKDNSNVVISQIQKYRRGSIMDGLNSSLIKEFVIPIPPIDEQKRIVAYLDTKVSLIDELISSFNAQHSDLNALKQAIISEAVTGKIDLRDWTPSVEQ